MCHKNLCFCRAKRRIGGQGMTELMLHQESAPLQQRATKQREHFRANQNWLCQSASCELLINKDNQRGLLKLLAFTTTRLCWCCSVTAYRFIISSLQRFYCIVSLIPKERLAWFSCIECTILFCYDNGKDFKRCIFQHTTQM